MGRRSIRRACSRIFTGLRSFFVNHPAVLFLLLMPSQVTCAALASGTVSTYDAEMFAPLGYSHLPKLLRLQIEITSEDSTAGTTVLLQMKKAALLNLNGAEQPSIDIAQYPALVVFGFNGMVTSFRHHIADTSEAIAVKKAVAGALQIQIGHNGRVRERHLNGISDASYSTTTDSEGVVAVNKSHNFLASSLPPHLKYTQSESAVFARNGTLLKLTQVSKWHPAAGTTFRVDGSAFHLLDDAPGRLDLMLVQAQPSKRGRVLSHLASAYFAHLDSVLLSAQTPDIVLNRSFTPLTSTTACVGIKGRFERALHDRRSDHRNASRELQACCECPEGLSLIETELKTVCPRCMTEEVHCIRLIKGVSLAGTPQAHRLLPPCIRAANGDMPFPVMHSLAVDISAPSAALLEAVADAVNHRRQSRPVSGRLGRQEDQWILTLASITRKARSSGVDGVKLEAYEKLIETDLESLLAADEVWGEMHGNATLEAEALWESIGWEERDLLAAHVHQLGRDMIQWELAARGSLTHLHDGLREQLPARFLQKVRPSLLTATDESLHLERLSVALKAAGNLAPQKSSSIKMVERLIDHRDEGVAYAAIAALRSHKDQPRCYQAQAALVRVLERPTASKLSHVHAIQALHTYRSVPRSVADVAVRLMVRMEWHGDEVDGCEKVCLGQCAPHHVDACKKSCARRCQEHGLLEGELSQLLERVPMPRRQQLLLKHMSSIHPSRRRLVRLTFIDLLLSHRPLRLGWKKGSERLFGPLGGLAAEARVIANNNAWLRVGLFGGGFGFDIYNEALMKAVMVALGARYKHEFFYGSLQYKIDSSYRFDPPADLKQFLDGMMSSLDSAMDTLDNVVDAGLAGLARTIEQMQAWIDRMMQPVRRILLGLPTQAVNFVIAHLPPLVRQNRQAFCSVLEAAEKCKSVVTDFGCAEARRVEAFVDGLEPIVRPPQAEKLRGSALPVALKKVVASAGSIMQHAASIAARVTGRKARPGASTALPQPRRLKTVDIEQPIPSFRQTRVLSEFHASNDSCTLKTAFRFACSTSVAHTLSLQIFDEMSDLMQSNQKDDLILVPNDYSSRIQDCCSTGPQVLAVLLAIEFDHPDWDWQRTVTSLRKLTHDSA
ncbi:MAG: hypothetical protein SGPRY_009393, partial [Prymnesium sp.]